jgi:hypothetical protein
VTGPRATANAVHRLSRSFSLNQATSCRRLMARSFQTVRCLLAQRAPRAWISSEMAVCLPLASMGTVQPVSDSAESNSGMATISLDLTAVARCPSTSPTPAAKDETNCSAVASTPSDRRLVLPSTATISVPRAGKTLPTQRRKAGSNWSGSISPRRRPKVSWEGTPWSSSK